ncbi:MAG: hypothetical protein V7K21_01400 [Nostoc sp.]|uniref:hypothetical protein n=1 Tax=Nostoc sp. TaxID=1180 RepID=UPI002FF774D5
MSNDKPLRVYALLFSERVILSNSGLTQELSETLIPLCPTLREATSCLCVLCGSLRQAASLGEAAPTRLRFIMILRKSCN